MGGSGISKGEAGTQAGARRPRGPSKPGQFPQAGVPAQPSAPRASCDAVWTGSHFWPGNQQQLGKKRETSRNSHSFCLLIQSVLHLFIHPPIHLSIHPSILLCIYPSLLPSIHPQPYLYPSICRPSIHHQSAHPLFVCLSTCSSIHPPIHQFIHKILSLTSFPIIQQIFASHIVYPAPLRAL